jgi:hypothetical protein
MLKAQGKIVAILVVGAIFLMNTFIVLGDESPGSIHGIVFVDENGNGQYDPGEPVLEGVTIGLTNGEIILETKTDGDGAFSFSVGSGVWQGVIYPPLGYSVVNDATREVVIELEGSLEAVLDFGLVAEPAADQDGAGSAENPQEIEVEEEAVVSGSEDMAETEYYEGEAPVSEVIPADNSNQDDSQIGIPGRILPESGFPVPLRWILGAIVVVILVVGASLIFLGRRLLR